MISASTGLKCGKKRSSDGKRSALEMCTTHHANKMKAMVQFIIFISPHVCHTVIYILYFPFHIDTSDDTYLHLSLSLSQPERIHIAVISQGSKHFSILDIEDNQLNHFPATILNKLLQDSQLQEVYVISTLLQAWKVTQHFCLLFVALSDQDES